MDVVGRTVISADRVTTKEPPEWYVWSWVTRRACLLKQNSRFVVHFFDEQFQAEYVLYEFSHGYLQNETFLEGLQHAPNDAETGYGFYR